MKKTNFRFTPKTFGYGLVPISRQGWIVSLIITGLSLLSAYTNNFFSDIEPSGYQIARFIVDIFVICAIFIILMKDKTDGEIKRRRGKK